MQFESKKIEVYSHSTETAFDNILISVGEIVDDEPVKLTIGSVGSGNITGNLEVGGFLLYERNDNEIYDIRLLRKFEVDYEADFLVSRLDASDVFGEVSRMTDYKIWHSDRLQDNEGFEEDETHLLRERLDRFEKKLNEQFSLNEQHSVFVSQRIDYLKDAIGRQGRVDWLHTAIGVFVSIAMTLGVSIANDTNFWRLIKEAMGVPIQLLLGSG